MVRSALLVGINDYSGANTRALANKRTSLPVLNGCLRDVANMRRVLKENFRYADTDIEELPDAAAQRKTIIDRLTEMVIGAKSEDQLLFYFAGHGSRLPIDPGREIKGPNDVMEILCPYDMDWDDKDRYITDRDLKAIVEKLPDNCTLEVVLDACKSGGMDEVPFSLKVKRNLPTFVSKRLPKWLTEDPPMIEVISASTHGIRFAASPFITSYVPNLRRLSSIATPDTSAVSSKRCIVWMATARSGAAWEGDFGAGICGAFTHFFTTQLAAQPSMSRGQMFAAVDERLKQSSKIQRPDLLPKFEIVQKRPFLTSGVP